LIKMGEVVQEFAVRELENAIRDVPDFPKKGIIFKDITTLLKKGDLFASSVDYMYDHYREKTIDIVTAIESRGFILGAALAYKLNVGFVPIRKADKLPAKKLIEKYDLEYGTDQVEIHKDAIEPGMQVLLVDDLLATGGTALAACKLIQKLKGKVVGIVFLIELSFLHGRELLKGWDVHSLIKYETE